MRASICRTPLVALLAIGLSPQATQARPQAPKTCGTMMVTGSPGGRYVVQVEPASTGCKAAKSVVRRYLRTKAPATGTIDGWRCSYSRKGTVAEGTAFKVTCRKGARRIHGFYRGA